jgi:acetoacetyl-CoA synthetase
VAVCIFNAVTNPIWIPGAEDIESARLTKFMRSLPQLTRGAMAALDAPSDYHSLWKWSVESPEQFWPAIWRWGEVVGGDDWIDVLVGGEWMAPPDPQRGPRWFTGARLNFAENLLRRSDYADAIISWDESGRRSAISFRELRAETGRIAAGLRALGIGPGDRVVGYMPNVPETVIAMLATASVGAIWSSCSPDFGVQGVLDRFGQIEPRVLIHADGYRYAGKEIALGQRVAEIVQRIPSIEATVEVKWLGHGGLESRSVTTRWKEFGTPGTQPQFTRLPFDHPLYIMYSSGTTGLPKCMVHGAGGTLLQHIKELSLHTDVARDDRVFYFTTCGWMMWNWLVSCLALEATIVLYDGAPFARDEILWDMARDERVAIFGTSARYLALLEKTGAKPAVTHDMPNLRAILSTGSPLADHSYDYVAADVKPGVRLSSISGGTDLLSCFAGGNPIAPVWRGELQTRGLAMAVEVWNEDGKPVREQPGELVCTRPFPSMPVSFWNDPDGSRYQAAYFEHFPGVWRHGDWAELTAHDGMIIYGRSDATLNPGGVRIGTAEIYRQVELVPEVVESLVIGQDIGEGSTKDVRIVLFVRLREGASLDEGLRERIRVLIRKEASPHHVPKKIIAVADIPRTISGKITELAVRDVVHGRAVKNREALANPEALDLFRNLPELID